MPDKLREALKESINAMEYAWHGDNIYCFSALSTARTALAEPKEKEWNEASYAQGFVAGRKALASSEPVTPAKAEPVKAGEPTAWAMEEAKRIAEQGFVAESALRFHALELDKVRRAGIAEGREGAIREVAKIPMQWNEEGTCAACSSTKWENGHFIHAPGCIVAEIQKAGAT